MRSAPSEEFAILRPDVCAARPAVASNAAADPVDMEGGRSTWSAEVKARQTNATRLQNDLAKVRDKCEDMEGRVRRGNIGRVGVEEQLNFANPKEVLKEAVDGTGRESRRKTRCDHQPAAL